MDLPTVLRAIRKLWIVVVALVLLGVGTGALVALLTPQTFRSSTSVLFSLDPSVADNASELAQGNNYTAQTVASYPQIVTSPRVLDAVIQQLDLHTDARTLAKQIQASALQDSSIVTIDADAANPQDAVTLVNTVRERFVSTAGALQRTSDGTTLLRAEVLQPAVRTDDPVAPDELLCLALGGFAGLVVGLALAILLGVVDRRVNNRYDVRRLADANVLGGIPGRLDPGRPLAMVAEPQGATARGYRMVVASLLLDRGLTANTSLAVLSSLPREHAAVVSANLGVALAESGLRTVVVDTDFTSGELTRAFDLQDRSGLAQRLAGTDAGEPIETTTPGLAVVPTGSGGGPLSAPLATAALTVFLEELRSTTDVVLLHCAPLLTQGEGTLLLAAADQSLLAVRVGHLTAPELTASLESIAQSGRGVAGLVLTDVPTSGPDSDAHSRALAAADGAAR